MTSVSAENSLPLHQVTPQETESFINQFFAQPEVKSALKGAVVTVVHDQQIVLNKGYGYANAEKQIPVDADSTLFRVASISKTLTATAIMQLAEQGNVKLDQDISAYTDALHLTNHTGTTLTLEHLMTHTSGFDFTDAVTIPGSWEYSYPLEQFIKDNKPSVVRTPGEVFRYDNYGYALLGYIVQKSPNFRLRLMYNSIFSSPLVCRIAILH